jgi:hypothetical protein
MTADSAASFHLDRNNININPRYQSNTLSACQPDQFAVDFRNKRCFVRGPISEVQLYQLNNIMRSSDEWSIQV